MTSPVKTATSYRKRSDRVQAYQYHRASCESMRALLEAWGVTFKKPTAHGLVLHIGADRLTVREGDYLVRDSYGRVTRVASDRFELAYEIDKI